MTKRGAPVEVELRDGSKAILRPIRPDDKPRLQEGLQRLSPRSRYLRFHSAVNRLNEQQLRYLTEIDYHDHMAWVALDPARPDHPGMGVARYVRLRDEPEVAEAAVTVADEYQGLGLGTILLAFLAKSALDNGITVFRNYVLADNAAMLELFDQLGATRMPEEAGVYRVDLALPKDPADLPQTPAGQAIRALAVRSTSLLPFGLPPVWLRRSRAEDRDDGGSQAPPEEAVGERGQLRGWLDAVLARDEGGSEDDDETA